MPCFQKGQALHTWKQARFDLDAEHYVIVREMGSKDFLDFEAKYPSDSKATVYDVVCDMLSRCLVDDAGNLLFADMKDLQANLNVGISVLWALRDKVNELSNPTKKEPEAKN